MGLDEPVGSERKFVHLYPDKRKRLIFLTCFKLSERIDALDLETKRVQLLNLSPVLKYAPLKLRAPEKESSDIYSKGKHIVKCASEKRWFGQSLVAIEKMPGWVRAAEIILGLVSVVAGILVIVYPGLGFFTLVAIVAFGLIFLGWRDIILGTMGKFLPTWLRAADIIFGVLAFVLSAIVIGSPGVAIFTLVVLLYFALFVRGVATISMAAAAKMFSTRLRAASAAVGVLSIILALVILAFPGLLVGTLIFLLSLGLFFVGIEAVVAGIIGREIVPMIASAQTKI